MRRIYFRFFGRFFRSKNILFFFFISGLLLSFLAAASAGETLISTMRMVASAHVSIIGLLSALLIPIFISAYAVYSNEFWIVPILAFLKAFAFGYCALSITVAFGSAGWLSRCLVLFSDIHLLCLLWWFWLRHYPANRSHLGLNTIISVAVAVSIFVLDSLLFAPFWVRLHQ